MLFLVYMKGCDGKNQNFRVRRKVVLDALIWLKNNNPLYSGISIDLSRIESLPVDDILEIPNIIVNEEESCALDTGPVEDKEKIDQVETSSFLPSSHTQPKEFERLSETISEREMQVEKETLK